MGQQDYHPLSPRLLTCPEGLPRAAYMDLGWYDREMATIFARQWVMVGRVADFPAGKMRRVLIGEAQAIVVRDSAGQLAAYHNSCPHRGSELCREDEEEIGKLIRCPYHAFAYAAADGRLVSTAHAVPTDDFDRSAHGLRPVSLRAWNGFLFLNLNADPGEIWSDVGLHSMDTWPMDSLVTGHIWEAEIACNWKTFWENYSECLHCPGIHPELCDLVPLYGRGIMSPPEAPEWTPDGPEIPLMKEGATTWTMDGKPCGPIFDSLTPADIKVGYGFASLWPSSYVVAHIDYVRSVRVVPLGPERTKLVAEWYFSAETLAQPGFDPADVAAFAKIVMEQDGDAAEMNQRGMRSPAFKAARLMPEEYDIYRFHDWIRAEMEGAP
jgi:Rieske 2Fe-2S family protein